MGVLKVRVPPFGACLRSYRAPHCWKLPKIMCEPWYTLLATRRHDCIHEAIENILVAHAQRAQYPLIQEWNLSRIMDPLSLKA